MTDWNPYSGTESQDGEDAGAWGVWFNRVHTFEVGEGGEPHCAFPALLPALRGTGLRDGLPDRRLL